MPEYKSPVRGPRPLSPGGLFTWPRVRRAFALIGALIVGAVIGYGTYVILNQGDTIRTQNAVLERRTETIEYLQADNEWQRCLLRQDVKYKVAFLGGVVALRGDPDEAASLIAQAEEQRKAYEDIDKVCPPPEPPKFTGTGKEKGPP